MQNLIHDSAESDNWCDVGEEKEECSSERLRDSSAEEIGEIRRIEGPFSPKS